jgi:hypothetical protein
MKRSPMPRRSPLRSDPARLKAWRSRPRKLQRRSPSGAYADARAVVWRRAGGRCEAEGLHHADCPGWSQGREWQFVTHHVLPRSANGPDEPANLLLVWNGLTGLGAGGCHGRIHAEARRAVDLGLLAR